MSHSKIIVILVGKIAETKRKFQNIVQALETDINAENFIIAAKQISGECHKLALKRQKLRFYYQTV